MPVNKGDILSLPIPAAVNVQKITVKWSQNLSSRSADYFPLVVKNKSQGDAEVALFIAAEWFNEQYLNSVAQKVGDRYQLTIDSKYQYGQKNDKGEMRFVVYHDESRKPYQHRFIETAFGSMANDAAQRIASVLGYGGQANIAGEIFKNFVGDYLHTF